MTCVSEALKYYGNRLSEFERTEIEKFPEIWYLGLDACKIHGEEGLAQNGGYDDDNGSYNKVHVITFPLRLWLNLISLIISGEQNCIR